MARTKQSARKKTMVKTLSRKLFAGAMPVTSSVKAPVIKEEGQDKGSGGFAKKKKKNGINKERLKRRVKAGVRALK